MRAKSMKTTTVKFGVFLGGLLGIVAAATAGFMAVEGFSPVDALYFSVVTITTVGFGDLHPVTPAGKVLAVIVIVTGVGAFTGMVAAGADMILSRRERRQRMEKLNMVIGAFFSEVGTRLLAGFSDHDPHFEKVRKALVTASKCPDDDFERISRHLDAHPYSIDVHKVNLKELRAYLGGKRGFLLRLVENPALLEHETFTDLLMAVFHLTEELIHRDRLGDLPERDLNHIGGDIERVYGMLVSQWLDYMRYLKASYPYLFSLAIRTNPFDLEASPVVT